jgi:hypothetical protein
VLVGDEYYIALTDPRDRDIRHIKRLCHHKPINTIGTQLGESRRLDIDGIEKRFLDVLTATIVVVLACQYADLSMKRSAGEHNYDNHKEWDCQELHSLTNQRSELFKCVPTSSTIRGLAACSHRWHLSNIIGIVPGKLCEEPIQGPHFANKEN